eukprot:s1096_g24.t1
MAGRVRDVTHVKPLCFLVSHVLRDQAPMGHVLPVEAVQEFVASPAGMQHQASKSMPEHVALVVKALDKPKPQHIDGMPEAVQVRHSKVVSLCDPDKMPFATEALCSMSDIFAYNMGDGKPRYVVGFIRLTDMGYVITVDRVFALDGDEVAVAELHRREIAALKGLTVRRGTKQKANTLMEITPAKRPYHHPATTAS